MKSPDELRQEKLDALRRRMDATDRMVRHDVRAGGGPGHVLWHRTRTEAEAMIDRAVLDAAERDEEVSS